MLFLRFFLHPLFFLLIVALRTDGHLVHEQVRFRLAHNALRHTRAIILPVVRGRNRCCRYTERQLDIPLL
jgi:hypothetical protein